MEEGAEVSPRRLQGPRGVGPLRMKFPAYVVHSVP